MSEHLTFHGVPWIKDRRPDRPQTIVETCTGYICVNDTRENLLASGLCVEHDEHPRLLKLAPGVKIGMKRRGCFQ